MDSYRAWPRWFRRALDPQAERSLVEWLFWRPHASPASVWWFVAAFPVLTLAIYRRSRLLRAGTLLSVVVNLLVVTPPVDDDPWATRVVRGEQVSLERRLLSSRADLLFTAAAGLVNVFTLLAAVGRRPVVTAVGTLASLVLTFVFFARMGKLFERAAAKADAG